jgi:DtxR family Mn-dependent transcriptional regulator
MEDLILWWALAAVAAAAGAIWMARGQRRRGKEAVDDALKYLYTLDRGDLRATPEELGPRLRLKRRAVARLIETLAEYGLARMSHGTVKLTPAGKAMGLHLLRAHRLWERHLADNTGVALEQVHRLAEKREHTLSPEEVRALEARLGFPGSDPHGDVIPDEAGGARAEGRRSAPLTDWPVGVPGRIAHIEDEPEDLFTQILSLGLVPGAKVVVRESSAKGVRVVVDDEEAWLAPMLATQVEVVRPEKDEEPEGGARLADLRPGESARVVTLSREVRGLLRRRLLDLGFTRGARVEPVLRSSFARGDPSAYRIRGTVIALRKEQAAQIIVERVETKE